MAKADAVVAMEGATGRRRTAAVAVVLAGLVVPVLTAAPAAPQTANLVVNGSFEEPVIASLTFAPSIPGWSVAPNSTGSSIEVQRSVAGAPHQGAQHVELDSDGSIGMVQTVPTTSGQSYVLRFAFSPRPMTPAGENRLEVRWGGTTLATIEGGAGGQQTAWTCYVARVTASGSQTELEFRDAGPSDTYGTYLDDVRLRDASPADVLFNQTPRSIPCSTPDVAPPGPTTTTTTSTTSSTTSTTVPATTSTTGGTSRDLPATGDEAGRRLLLAATLLVGAAGGGLLRRSRRSA